MRKFMVYGILLIGLLVLTTGCNLQRDNLRGATINTTIYPIEYLTAFLYNGLGPTLSIYPDGTNPFDYDLTDKQLTDASSAGIFVFNGHGKERDYARTMIMENRNLKLIDATNNTRYEHNIHELWLDPINALILAFCVSIDSFSVGFGLKGITDNALLSSLIFGLISGVISYAGLVLGHQISHILKENATKFGALILFLLAIVKLVLEIT